MGGKRRERMSSSLASVKHNCEHFAGVDWFFGLGYLFIYFGLILQLKNMQGGMWDKVKGVWKDTCWDGKKAVSTVGTSDLEVVNRKLSRWM